MRIGSLVVFISVLGFSFAAAAAGPTKAASKPGIRPVAHEAPVEAEVSGAVPIRQERPVTLSLSGIGRTPFFGALVEVNLLPYVALGTGYGFFSVDTVSGSFIPVYLQAYALKSNFSPYLAAGLDFVTVTFQSANSLLNSTFRGTQFILGAGLEYRFDFGLNLRADAVRFVNARIWSPGLAIGYSVVTF